MAGSLEMSASWRLVKLQIARLSTEKTGKRSQVQVQNGSKRDAFKGSSWRRD